MPETLFAMGLSGDRGFKLKAITRKILTGFSPILRRVLKDPLGNISASQKLGRKKKKEPGKTTQLATQRTNINASHS